MPKYVWIYNNRQGSEYVLVYVSYFICILLRDRRIQNPVKIIVFNYFSKKNSILCRVIDMCRVLNMSEF